MVKLITKNLWKWWALNNYYSLATKSPSVFFCYSIVKLFLYIFFFCFFFFSFFSSFFFSSVLWSHIWATFVNHKYSFRIYACKHGRFRSYLLFMPIWTISPHWLEILPFLYFICLSFSQFSCNTQIILYDPLFVLCTLCPKRIKS